MDIKRVEPDEARKLVGEGWKYLDVRSVPEFEQGHPEGAYNIPLLNFLQGAGMSPNTDFLAVVKETFQPDESLVIGCKSGGRSYRAAQALIDAGFGAVVDMRGGFSGEADPTGAVACEGWASRGLPVARQAEPGRSYEELRSRGRG